MVIIILLMNVISTFPDILFTKEKEISLYPTEGEFYEYYLTNFVPDYQLKCKIDPQVPNVQVVNQCEEIYRMKGNQFKSMSSNNTHFGTLSYKNEVTLYEWKNSMIEQVGESVSIDSSFNCFNINLSQQFSILIDCYYNNEFILIQLMNTQSRIFDPIQSFVPNSTKIQSIVNGTNAFIVYAQYFENYSILSLFSSQFLNLSSLNNQFVDFDIPITISPFIYAITFKEIFQLSISSDSQFYLKYNFSQFGMSSFTSINAYYNIWTYSQCDQIALINQGNVISYLLGCENEIISIGVEQQSYYESLSKILQNHQFIVCQLKDKILIQEIQEILINSIYFYNLYHSSNSLLYFNSDTVVKNNYQEYMVQIIRLNIFFIKRKQF